MLRYICVVVVLLAAPTSAVWAWGEVPRQGLTAPAEQSILDALDRPIELHLRHAPLGHLVDLCRSQRIPAVLDEKALKDVGVRLDEPVSIDISGISLRAALDAALQPLDLTWMVRNGVLWISTPEEGGNNPSLRTYDVRDLVPFVVVDGERSYDVEMIIEIITSTVMPNTWDEVGGPGAIHEYQNGDVLALVIDQTQEVHREIDVLLWQLRQYRGRSWSLPTTSRSTAASRLDVVPTPTERQSRRYINTPTWAEKAARQHQPPHADQPRSPDAAKGFF